MKNSSFYKQAELMLRCLAPLDQHRDFALKGGTALNFFIFDLPRLSVDIDLVYLPEKDYEGGLKAISNELESLGDKIKSLIPNSKIQKTTSKNSKPLSIVKQDEDLFETSQETLLLDTDEILAGKI